MEKANHIQNKISEPEGKKNPESKTRVIEKLYELFRIEEYNLDFGIFKILQYKQKQIEEFIHNQLENTIKSIEGTGLNDLLYDHIYNFFSQYYEHGDFILKRRYSNMEKYSIPYNGEDVYLHWNTKEQYYIKSSEFFPMYSFTVAQTHIVFETDKEDIQLEKANAKEQDDKYFIFKSITKDQENRIIIKFAYREFAPAASSREQNTQNPKGNSQTQINSQSIKAILEVIPPELKTELEKKHQKKNGEISELTELEWHLQRFTQKNTADFFIHKDLNKFLSKELESYIKSEIFNLNSILTQDNTIPKSETTLKTTLNELFLKVVLPFSSICSAIIEFLSQIENFQKKLWEKPKFIISTEYLITLDLIDQKYYPEILQNRKQIEEWQRLNLIPPEENSNNNQTTLDRFTPKIPNKQKGITTEYLSTHPTLMIDTKFFDTAFKWTLLGELEDIDGLTRGILINSDNFHALRLLQPKFKEKITCCYIDPPYNIAGDEFIYKDNFRDSSWLTMLQNRLELCKHLLSNEGLFFSSIDDAMVSPYSLLLESIFPERLKNIIWHKKTQPSFLTSELIPVTEYILVAKNSTEKIDMVGGFGNPDKPAELLNISNKKDKRIIPKNAVIIQNGWTGVLKEKIYGKDELQIELLNAPVTVTNGIPEKDLELFGRFKWTQERIYQEIAKGGKLFIKSTDSLRPTMKRVFEEPIVKAPITLLSKKLDEQIPTNTDGNNELKRLFKTCPFNYPKPVGLIKYLIRSAAYNNKKAWVLDFFAGSGTTGDAVLELNKSEDFDLKFILVEMGQYFETILKPRIMKKTYSQNWKDGIPEDADGSQKQIIKYHSLEQYEDTILNIEFQQAPSNIQHTQDYTLKYMLDFESKSNPIFFPLDCLDNPFSYRLKLITNSGVQYTTIDIVETFNYLLGIKVRSTHFKDEAKIAAYLIIKGTINNKNAIIVWREKKSEFDPIKEKALLDNIIPNISEFEERYLPGDCLLQYTESIEYAFKKFFCQF